MVTIATMSYIFLYNGNNTQLISDLPYKIHRKLYCAKINEQCGNINPWSD